MTRRALVAFHMMDCILLKWLSSHLVGRLGRHSFTLTFQSTDFLGNLCQHLHSTSSCPFLPGTIFISAPHQQESFIDSGVSFSGKKYHKDKCALTNNRVGDLARVWPCLLAQQIKDHDLHDDKQYTNNTLPNLHCPTDLHAPWLLHMQHPDPHKCGYRTPRKRP